MPRALARSAAPLFAALLLASTAVPTTAQQGGGDLIPIGDLVVTATPVPLPLASLGNRTTILQGAAIRARGITSVADALRDVTGVTLVRSGSFGATTSLFLRGGESDYVQVLIDGVPLNQPGGTVDLSGLSMEGVERIEIVRGASSALYGSDAVAGVIQIITRRGGAGSSGSLMLRGGSHGTFDGVAELRGANESASYDLSFARYATDGILAFNNQHVNTGFSGRAQLEIDERSTARVSARVSDRTYGFPTDDAGAAVDINQSTYADETALSFELDRRFSDRLTLRALATYHSLNSGTDDAPDGPEDNTGFFGFQSLDALRAVAVDLRANWEASEDLILTLGTEVEDQRVRSWNESLSEFGPTAGRSENARRNVGGYAHAVVRAGGFDLAAGVRVEDNDQFGTFTTGRLSVAREVREGTNLRGAVGTGLKEATFFEAFADGFARGNPDLEPERSRSWELGVQQEFAEGVTASATWFDQVFQDLIQYTGSPPEPGGPNYFNVAEATARGLELEVAALIRAIRVNAGWTWLDTEVTDSGFQSGEGATFVEGAPLLRRPEHIVSVGVAGGIGDRLSWSAGARRTGDRADRAFDPITFEGVPVVLEAYTLLDLGAEFTLVEPEGGRLGFALLLRGENLGDTEYQEAEGFPAPGRSIYVGGRFRWGGR